LKIEKILGNINKSWKCRQCLEIEEILVNKEISKSTNKLINKQTNQQTNKQTNKSTNNKTNKNSYKCCVSQSVYRPITILNKTDIVLP